MKNYSLIVFDHTNKSEKIWKEAFKRVNLYLNSVGVNIVFGVHSMKSDVPTFSEKVGSSWRVDKEWFRNTYTRYAIGSDFVLSYYSIFQWLRPHPFNSFRGQSIDENLGVSEMVLTGSFTKNAERPLAPGVKESEFVTRFLHEFCHSMFDHKLYQPDTTHSYHYDKKNLLEAFKTWKLPMKINELLPLVSRKQARFLEKCQNEGLSVRVTEGFRSIERQDALYAQGRTTPGAIVTNAKGGESYHNWGCAFDVIVDNSYDYTNPDWKRVGEIGESLGFEWGGRWPKFADFPHFEMRLGNTFKEFQDGTVDLSKFA